jgi:hypothetical protein
MANAHAMASVMADISTHIVIRVYIKAMANRVGLNHFKVGLLEAGLRIVTANRERRKIDTTAGLLATAGKKFIWHVYVVSITGPTFGFNWPKKILIDVDGQILNRLRDPRQPRTRGQGHQSLPPLRASRLQRVQRRRGPDPSRQEIQDPHLRVRENKELANSRKARRIEHKDIDIRAALKAPPPKGCSRFLNGICLLNKKGKKFSSNHNIKDAWVTSPEGKLCCTIECALQPHSMLQGYCLLGKECLYKHTKKCAALYYSHPNPGVRLPFSCLR